MKNQQISVNWITYDNTDNLSISQQQLLKSAFEALDKAHAPYSKFQVGAAVLLDNGAVISGANFENAAYPMCLCAERSALAAAISNHPDAVVKAMAIRVRNPKQVIDEPAAPCGACRQVMVEVEGRQQSNMQLLLQGETGKIYVLESAKVLLPFYFDGSVL